MTPYQLNEIKNAREENKLKSNFNNFLSKKLFELIFDAWDLDRKDTRVKMLLEFQKHVNCEDEEELFNCELSFAYYSNSKQVKEGIIMNLAKYFRIWRNFYEMAIEQGKTIKNYGGSEIERYKIN